MKNDSTSNHEIPASAGIEVLVIGAGLCGSLLALRLAQRGHKVQLMEKRPDLRKTKLDAGRSINLAFSDRGIKAMELVGIQEKVEKLCIPMNGRMIHDREGNTFLSPYSGKKEEYINSVSRPGLNALLLDEAEKMPNVSISFNQNCLSVDFDPSTGSGQATAEFEDFHSKEKTTLKAAVIFGTDGAGSAVRQSMEKNSVSEVSQEFLSHGYKELSIPATKNGGWKIHKNALHIWPRGENMLIALPNMDGSFTVTLFLSHQSGDYNFDNLKTPEKVREYFEKDYADALESMPGLTTDFFENPIGELGTVKCFPWQYRGKVLLMGDAAHAIVPFYGQGMNASFEDVVVLDAFMQKHQNNWGKIFSEYEQTRKKDADAIADLALDNFHEMKEATADPLFQQKRKLETAFEQEFPEEYSSKYRLVTFQEEIPYSEAMKKGRAQDEAMLKLIAEGKFSEEMSLREKLELVKKETQKL
jgi:kynurenine 3-monooxygenase